MRDLILFSEIYNLIFLVPARTELKANAVGKIPSVEEVMAKWGCDRETAQGYIDENMY